MHVPNHLPMAMKRRLVTGRWIFTWGGLRRKMLPGPNEHTPSRKQAKQAKFNAFLDNLRRCAVEIGLDPRFFENFDNVVNGPPLRRNARYPDAPDVAN